MIQAIETIKTHFITTHFCLAFRDTHNHKNKIHNTLVFIHQNAANERVEPLLKDTNAVSRNTESPGLVLHSVTGCAIEGNSVRTIGDFSFCVCLDDDGRSSTYFVESWFCGRTFMGKVSE